MENDGHQRPILGEMNSAKAHTCSGLSRDKSMGHLSVEMRAIKINEVIKIVILLS